VLFRIPKSFDPDGGRRVTCLDEAVRHCLDERRRTADEDRLSLRRILSPKEVSGDDVFVDVGSAIGRIMLQAAMHYPFRRVGGVEISAQLRDIAMTNLATSSSRLCCPRVELRHAGALIVDVPDDVTVVFLCNSFTAGRCSPAAPREPLPGGSRNGPSTEQMRCCRG
jgi:histone methylation protein DOT1